MTHDDLVRRAVVWLRHGVAGFGDSPDAAMRAFDKAWSERLPQKTPAN